METNQCTFLNVITESYLIEPENFLLNYSETPKVLLTFHSVVCFITLNEGFIETGAHDCLCILTVVGHK